MTAVAAESTKQRVLETFRRDGIAVARFDELFGADLWQDAVADIAPFVAAASERGAASGSASTREKEELIVRRFYTKDRTAPKHRYALSDPWLRIAACDTVLDIVNEYAGEQMRLTYLDNWYTVPHPDGAERVASQRWHRDPEDEHIVKMFVYLSDVDEEAGPFEYIRGSAAGGKYGDLFAWRDGYDYPPAEEFEARVDLADQTTATGPAGTVLFADTAGFHRGGFALTKPRVMMISTFLRHKARKARRRFEVDFEGREETLSPQVRHALAR
jgi:hypothetical protein